MKELNKTKQIMKAYFGKNFSCYGRSLFGRWLKAEDNKKTKTKLLQELWDQSSSTITEKTYSDWNTLHNLLPTQLSHKAMPFYRNWFKYAAVAGLMLLSAGTTLWLTKPQNTPDNITMTEFFVPYGESQQIMLPDSSTVWLNAGSLLVFPASFDKMESRMVYLTGEASFNIQKDKEKTFIVKTAYTDVRVLGTVFTVKAYPNDPYTSTTLEEGSVLVQINNLNQKSSILKPNQQLVYRHNSNTVSIQEIDISIHKMEQNGYLIYEKCTFSELMTSLERKFNITIHYNSQKFAKGLYNVKFAPEEKIEDVLQVLEQLIGIHYTIKENIVIIN